jgi:HlyD family secretion protein
MKAGIRIPSFPDRVFPGRVVQLDLLPINHFKEWNEKLRSFLAHVRFDETPKGAMPFMSASVVIETGRIPDALVIPVEAMAVVDRRQCCYVITSNRLERRPITTRNATTDLVEVTRGLKEGEHVVRRPVDLQGLPVDDMTQGPASDLAIVVHGK